MNEYTEQEILLIESIQEEGEELHPTNLSRYLSRLAFILIVLGCLFFMPSSIAKAQVFSITLYNNTNDYISIAYKYYDGNNCRCWVTTGWWNISPGGSSSASGNQSTFFFHASQPSTGRWWGRTDHYSFVKISAFEVNERYIQNRNQAQLLSEGFFQVSFARLDAASEGYNPTYYLR